MSVLKVYTYGAATLRKMAEEVREINESIYRLAVDMGLTMRQMEGMGLAATQIGISQRVIVFRPKEEGEPLALINPRIISREGTEILEEGCLSIPGIREKVKRSHHLAVEGLDLKGKKIQLEGEGLLARILEHEVDHLNGVLFIDHLSLVKKGLLRPKLKSLARQAQGK